MMPCPSQIFLIFAAALWACDIGFAADVENSKAVDPNPTLVTIHASNQSLTDIVKTIADQTGMPISVGFGMPSAPLTLDADRQPFWNVIDDLCTRTHSSIMPMWNGHSSLMIQFSGGQPQGRRIISGPVLLRLPDIQHNSVLTAPPDLQDFCEITGRAMWEPRLEVLFTDAWTIPSEAEDENGVSLVPDEAAPQRDQTGYARGENPYGRYAVSQRFNGNDAFARELHIRLHVPPTAGRRIKKLSGKWALFVPGKIDHFDISPIASKRQTSYTLGELGTMRLRFAQATDEVAQVQLDLPGGGMGANGPSAETAMRNCLLQSIHARVVDADGHLWGDTRQGRFNGGGQVNINMGGNETYINVYVRRDPSAKGKPVQLTIEGPVAATEIDVPFSLHDLPLP
jgi:hypothetical protein